MSRPALLLLSLLGLSQGLLAAGGWTEQSPRDEIRPEFSRNGDALVITHDAREGLDGWYQQTFAVQGGDFMKFSATRMTTGVENPRHSGLARIVWTDAKGKNVVSATPGATAEPEHPIDGSFDAQGHAGDKQQGQGIHGGHG